MDLNLIIAPHVVGLKINTCRFTDAMGSAYWPDSLKIINVKISFDEYCPILGCSIVVSVKDWT